MKMDKYLYEIIEDYKESKLEEEKAKVFKDFCSSIWGSNNKRRVITKTIRFNVRDDLLDTKIGQIFNMYSEIEYKTYKSMTKDDDWCSLIRQKINNLYTNYFDDNVILNKDYIDLLNKPKDLYYQWMYGKEMDSDELTNVIDESIHKSLELKSIYQKQKMNLSWSEYKKVVEDFLKKIFDNCKLLTDYEKEFGVPNIHIYEFIEDNFYIKYICSSLDGYMCNYQKEYYGLKRGRNKEYIRCKECGALIEKTNNKKMYCDKCALERKKASNKKSEIKYRNRMRENRKSKKPS